MFGNSKKEQQRQEKYQRLCSAHEMTFLDKDEFGTKAYLRDFELFRIRNGTIRNLCQKKSTSYETEINLFDYKYTVSTGKSFHVFDQTVFFINSKQLGLPEFYMKPEHMGHKIAAYLGWEDIDFENYPAFSDKYYLTGEHQEFIRDTFNERVLKFFSATNDWTIEAANYYLIFYAKSKLIPESILGDFYQLGMGIFDLFKSVK